MKLFLSQANSFKKRPLSPSAERCLAVINAAKPGELLNSKQLSAAASVPLTSLKSFVSYQIDTKYKHVHSGKMYYGKPATIRQLKKELQNVNR